MITSELNYANYYRRNKTTCRTSCYSNPNEVVETVEPLSKLSDKSEIIAVMDP